MKKYQWILFIALIGIAFTIIACEYADDLIHPVLTEPEQEVTQTETETTQTETTETETTQTETETTQTETETTQTETSDN